jgi:hypothetical protein
MGYIRLCEAVWAHHDEVGEVGVADADEVRVGVHVPVVHLPDARPTEMIHIQHIET